MRRERLVPILRRVDEKREPQPDRLFDLLTRRHEEHEVLSLARPAEEADEHALVGPREHFVVRNRAVLILCLQFAKVLELALRVVASQVGYRACDVHGRGPSAARTVSGRDARGVCQMSVSRALLCGPPSLIHARVCTLMHARMPARIARARPLTHARPWKRAQLPVAYPLARGRPDFLSIENSDLAKTPGGQQAGGSGLAGSNSSFPLSMMPHEVESTEPYSCMPRPPTGGSESGV